MIALTLRINLSILVFGYLQISTVFYTSSPISNTCIFFFPEILTLALRLSSDPRARL
jgi:hypothetical protein